MGKSKFKKGMAEKISGYSKMESVKMNLGCRE